MYTFKFHKRITDINAGHWNRLAAGAGPFLRHEFLAALEDSGSVCIATGWEPQHLVVYSSPESAADPEQSPCAVMPLYLKTHSFGEYVFDWAWADAWHANGVAYYPKLLTAIPFTPSTGPRLLMDPSCDRAALVPELIDAVQQHAMSCGASSWHVLFPEQQLSSILQGTEMIERLGTQFHWFNRGYASFTELLADFNSRKRKNIRKERQAVIDQGINFERLSGDDIDTCTWDRFYQYYRNTYLQRGRDAYLSRSFFARLAETMPENLLLVMARRGESPLAGALNLCDETTLYGRFWGCEEDAAFLHFETCYYQGIDYCIEHGLQRFDAGAQGEHKIQRGFQPVRTCSYHWVADSRFVPAISRFCAEEAEYVQEYMKAAELHLPFRREG